MNKLLLGVSGVLIAAQLSAAQSNLEPRSLANPITNTNDPVEREFKRVMDTDDAAQAEVDQWIQDNQQFAAKGAGEPNAEFNQRIRARLDIARRAYDDFLERHPDHARAHLAYAGFLEDLHEEDAARRHMERSRELDPKNPAAWNNLANYYGHFGDVKKSFEYYARAIELERGQSSLLTLWRFVGGCCHESQAAH